MIPCRLSGGLIAWCDRVDAGRYRQRHLAKGQPRLYHDNGSFTLWPKDELSEWLTGRSAVEISYDGERWTIWFMDMQDALLFKLTWGGK